MENDAFKTFQLDRELVTLKKEETMLIKDFQHIVDFFNRTLLLKEKVRIGLMEKIIDSEKIRNENFEKLKVVIRNLEIYDKNQEQLVEKQSKLAKREAWIKARYEEILHGSSSTPLMTLADGECEIFGDICQDLLSINKDLQRGSAADREELVRFREEYLRGMQSLFQKLDEELGNIDEESSKNGSYEFEIKKKKEKALKQQSTLKKNYNLLVDDIKKKRVDLELSVREERALIADYRKLIKQIQSNLEIPKEMKGLVDKILSSNDFLSSVGEKPELETSSLPVEEGESSFPN